MSTRTQQRLSTSSLALLAVAFIVAVSVTNQVFKGWRIDLTENNLYTLSDGTRSLLANLEGTINLYFYFSDQASQAMPSLRNYANRVREMLEEFEAEADGNIRLNVIDPLPFSEDEDRAAQFGLQGVRLGTSPDAVYMGLAGTDSIDNEEIIPFFQPDKETFLEYDIAKLVSTLSSPKRPVIGLISDVQMAGSFDPQTQRMSQPWVVYQQAQQLFEVRNLGTGLVQIADDNSQPLASLLRDEHRRLVRETLAELPADFRTVLVMKEFDGLSYEEIAGLTEVPLGTVRSRIHRGRSELALRLKRKLGDQAEG